MNGPEEQNVALIPRNFIEHGTFMGGMFKIRNAIEALILTVLILIPVVHLPLSLTLRIIILCMTALPAAMVALIGIAGESLTAFLMNAVRFLVNRRVIYRSDKLPEPKKRRTKARNKEPKPKKHRQKRKSKKREPAETAPSDDASGDNSSDSPSHAEVKKKEHRIFGCPPRNDHSKRNACQQRASEKTHPRPQYLRSDLEAGYFKQARCLPLDCR